MLELDCGLEFDPAREEDFYSALPARPAVFLIEPRDAGAQPYLLRTANLRRRAERLLRVPAEPTKRLNLREFAACLRYRLTGSAFEQSFVYYQHARAIFPRRYRELARLRPAALLKVNLRNAYPRCYVTRRIAAADWTGQIADGGFYFGPFASRKSAEAFADEFLDLFKIRRCRIKIRRDPGFPGCIYSEMKMCLAPCFAGCSKQEYDVEVGRVVNFLGTRGTSFTNEVGHEREAASEALDFERAAALHRRLEKVAEVLRDLSELPRKVDELDAVILQRPAEENAIAVFPVRAGIIAEPFFLRFGELASQPRSAEEILRQHLGTDPAVGRRSGGAERPGHACGEIPRGVYPDFVGAPNDTGASPTHSREELADHLALLARWYYSKPRAGEIFLRRGAGSASTLEDWPYRRIMRACSRLLASPGQPEQARGLV